MKLTFEEYDKIIDTFGKMKNHSCWPTPEQVDMFSKNPDKWLLFCIYLYEMNPPPSNKEEHESRRAMMKFINQRVELVDEEDSAL